MVWRLGFRVSGAEVHPVMDQTFISSMMPAAWMALRV